MTVPIIDLFAGPGGLGEGFASLKGDDGRPFFEIGLSIEKDKTAHKTLTLRAVYRQLKDTDDAHHYYRYVRGEIDEKTFRNAPAVSEAFSQASMEARCLELGEAEEASLDKEISSALKGNSTWVLIGGPPCQAYSLAGRSRRANDANFHKDEKHFLYKEYLRIIRVHKPSIFVMENVKGLLSSQHGGASMFERIIADLSAPAPDMEYEIRSFTKHGDGHTLKPVDYLIRSENYGIPQSRHRVILLGIRKGLNIPPHRLLRPVTEPLTVAQAIGDLPKIRSKLSSNDSMENWCASIQAATSYVRGWGTAGETKLIEKMRYFAAHTNVTNTGGAFTPRLIGSQFKPTEFYQWVLDPSLGGICQHESRGHMAKDLARYLFSATFAHLYKHSPRLDVFPENLLPDHVNVRAHNKSGSLPFNDRFRVQCAQDPAATVVAHIAKDGHYYIHYDPSQCRSLTVREAARLQTFPDNYFFEGNRTQQYTQIGNAVPPLLARKLAETVKCLLAPLKKQQGGRARHAKEQSLIKGGCMDSISSLPSL